MRQTRLQTCLKAWSDKAAAREQAADELEADPRIEPWQVKWKRHNGIAYARLAASLRRALKGAASEEDTRRLRLRIEIWEEKAAKAGLLTAERVRMVGSPARLVKRKARQAGHLALLATDLEASLS